MSIRFLRIIKGSCNKLVYTSLLAICIHGNNESLTFLDTMHHLYQVSSRCAAAFQRLIYMSACANTLAYVHAHNTPRLLT